MSMSRLAPPEAIERLGLDLRRIHRGAGSISLDLDDADADAGGPNNRHGRDGDASPLGRPSKAIAACALRPG